jgi:uncharacterized protein (UPF0333 family)
MKKAISLLLVIVLLVSMNVTAFAATGSKTVTTAGPMSISLTRANVSAVSNSLSFNFSSLPANAVVTKVEINGGTMTFGGQGVITTDRMYVKNVTDGVVASVAWDQFFNKAVITSNLLGTAARGQWQVYFSGSKVGGNGVPAIKSYKNVKLTVYYSY